MLNRYITHSGHFSLIEYLLRLERWTLNLFFLHFLSCFVLLVHVWSWLAVFRNMTDSTLCSLGSTIKGWMTPAFETWSPWWYVSSLLGQGRRGWLLLIRILGLFEHFDLAFVAYVLLEIYCPCILRKVIQGYDFLLAEWYLEVILRLTKAFQSVQST